MFERVNMNVGMNVDRNTKLYIFERELDVKNDSIKRQLLFKSIFLRMYKIIK